MVFLGGSGERLSEINRVLKPGGKTYIGGFGNTALKEQIVSAMKKKIRF